MAYRSGDGLFSFYMPFRHTNPGIVGNYNLHRFLPILQRIISTRTAIYHNAKYDLVSLRSLGIDCTGSKFFDTMILCHLLNENRLEGYSLDSCCKLYLGRPGKKKSVMFEKGIKYVGWEGATPEMHGEYAAYDTYSTLELFEAIAPMLGAEQLMPTWLHKAEFMKLLISMEGKGIRVDTDLCDAMAEEGEIRMWEIKEQIGGYNPASPKDLKILLIDQLRLPTVPHHKTGKPTFDKSAMEQYEQILDLIENPLAKLILEYRGWQKSVSSNYAAYLHLLSPDGRLRPNYKMHGTKTGRLSCEKPNLQQIPRSSSKPWNGALKNCFIPEPGYRLLECDYSQLEFRLAAAYAEEEALLAIFADPESDIFKWMAVELGWKRQEVKTFVYSILYGAGAKRVAFVFGVSLVEAKRRIDHFYETYPGLKRASRIAANSVIRNGKVQLWSGRYRHFVYPGSENHKAFNSVIQGGAADIVETTMLRLAANGLNDGTRCRMLLQVHDSVVFEVREDDYADACTTIQDLMSNVVPDFGVTFKAEPKEWGLAA